MFTSLRSSPSEAIGDGPSRTRADRWVDSYETHQALENGEMQGNRSISTPSDPFHERDIAFWRANANLIFRMGEGSDVDLLSEERALLHYGRLFERSNAALGPAAWTEVFVLVLDNYLIVTQREEEHGMVRHRVVDQPIALELVTRVTSVDTPLQRGNSIFRRASPHRGGRSLTFSSGFSIPAPTGPKPVYPFAIHHQGKHGGSLTLFADSAVVRNEWKLKLEEASNSRKAIQKSRKILDLGVFVIDGSFQSIFADAGSSSGSAQSAVGVAFDGKINCSMPFTTADRRDLVVIGGETGLWIGLRHGQRPMQRILTARTVTHCAILEDYGIFLVLADKSLYAYDLDALAPPLASSARAQMTPQKLSGSSEVVFFRVGSLGGTTFVIYAKRKRNDTTFRVLEPDVGRRSEKSPPLAELGRKEWFKLHRNFYVPSECTDVIFLQRKIALPCTEGFVIMSISDSHSVTIPQLNDVYKPLSKRCKSCKPRGMFRVSQDEFLLCYDKFGLYVDERGDPSRPCITVEWEGTAEHVAHLSPYVLLFNPEFIEVRHLQSGRLTQIIPGDGMRCLWDGRDRIPNALLASLTGVSPPPCVHGVMVAPASSTAARSRVGEPPVAAQVFDVVPIV